MDDLLYPDNANRRARVSEISNDISLLVNEAASDLDNIKLRLDEVNSLIEELYGKLSKNPPQIHAIPVVSDLETGAKYVLYSIAGLLTFAVVRQYLEKAAVSYLLRAGRIGPAAFARLAGLPPWLKLGTNAGAAVIVVGIELIAASIVGAIARDKLRGGIKDALAVRFTAKKANLINGLLLEELLSLITTLNYMRSLGATEDQLNKFQQMYNERISGVVARVTDDFVKSSLANLDTYRNSWTKEDNLIIPSNTLLAVASTSHDLDELKNSGGFQLLLSVGINEQELLDKVILHVKNKV